MAKKQKDYLKQYSKPALTELKKQLEEIAPKVATDTLVGKSNRSAEFVDKIAKGMNFIDDIISTIKAEIKIREDENLS